MDAATESALRGQLLDRRARLASAVAVQGEVQDLVRLLKEVDSALSRMDAGGYGSCEVCHTEIDEKDLVANPLMRYCLCTLSPQQQGALQNDLDLAWRIQAALLPRQDVMAGGWEIHYRYEPAGPVSGDYCDILTAQEENGEVLFVVADVSGKGVAASLLMSHLNASFRSLVTVGLPVPELMERANDLLLERTAASHYATLICGKARVSGTIEMCNAGHCEPLIVSDGKATRIESSGLPLGVVDRNPHTVQKHALKPGDSLVLYTDGVTETCNPDGEEYGVDRLARLICERNRLSPRALAGACLSDLADHRAATPRTDDLTLMIVRRC